MNHTNIKQLREAKNMSLYDLEKVSGISYSVLYYFEKKGRDIRISTAFRIADALECTLDELFDIRR